MTEIAKKFANWPQLLAATSVDTLEALAGPPVFFGTPAETCAAGPWIGGFFVCRACLTALGCKSPSHPDGGEVIAKRQGVVARRGLKAAWSKDVSRWTRTEYEAYGAGRAGK